MRYVVIALVIMNRIDIIVNSTANYVLLKFIKITFYTNLDREKMIDEHFEKIITKLKNKEIPFDKRNNYFYAWLEVCIDKHTKKKIKKAIEEWNQMEKEIIDKTFEDAETLVNKLESI